jgi:hypothetical protein
VASQAQEVAMARRAELFIRELSDGEYTEVAGPGEKKSVSTTLRITRTSVWRRKATT